MPRLAAIVLVATVGLVPGCDDASQSPAFPEPDQIYSDVRGRVTALPGDGPVGMPLSIRHEAIPEFVGADGRVNVNSDGSVGMKAMEMPFPEMAPGVSLDGLSQGDPISFEFAVAWDGRSPRYWITSIEELPADTTLDLPTVEDAPADP